MKVAILDPASGIAGDMFLGALVDVGLDKAWLERLPSTLGLTGVEVRIADVQRSGVQCVKVDFDIPAQPHGRAVSEIHRLIDAVQIPKKVAQLAHSAFEAIALIESGIHGVAPDDLHLHALRIIVGEAASDFHDHDHRPQREHVHTEHLHVLSADIDDMSPEELAGAADVLRADGALDVVLLHTTMKKGRPGTRVEALVQTSDLARLEEKIFEQFTTLGVKTFDVVRNALERESRLVRFDGRDIRVKVATLPDGSRRAKPEFDDLRRVAEETARPIAEIRSHVISALKDADLVASVARGK